MPYEGNLVRGRQFDGYQAVADAPLLCLKEEIIQPRIDLRSLVLVLQPLRRQLEGKRFSHILRLHRTIQVELVLFSTLWFRRKGQQCITFVFLEYQGEGSIQMNLNRAGMLALSLFIALIFFVSVILFVATTYCSGKRNGSKCLQQLASTHRSFSLRVLAGSALRHQPINGP